MLCLAFECGTAVTFIRCCEADGGGFDVSAFKRV